MAVSLEGFTIINLGYNLPAPMAASKLAKLGAHVIKIEPPGGDPFIKYCPLWYQELITGMELLSLDLKTSHGMDTLHAYLAESDCLITSNRLSSLKRLGLSWEQLQEQFPNLCLVSIFGYAPPNEEISGHDLTYQAKTNLITPPQLPKSLLADIWGAERAVQLVLEVLLHRSLTGEAIYKIVTLSAELQDLELPYKYGLTSPDGILGGAQARYNLYRTKNGWIALAALEDKFWMNMLKELGIEQTQLTKQTLETIFQTQSSEYWESWGIEKDIPIALVI